jgi:hypothetical protein
MNGGHLGRETGERLGRASVRPERAERESRSTRRAGTFRRLPAVRSDMRAVLFGAVAVGLAASAAFAASPGKELRTSGVDLAVPTGWHATVAKTPECDPERLIVASSGPLRVSATGRVASPHPGEVTVLLLEDRQVQDRPIGDLRRPRHFKVDWESLRTLSPDGYCGNPRGRAAMHYFKIHRRYLGFIVYPGSKVGTVTRAKTLALMDSLRVTS